MRVSLVYAECSMELVLLRGPIPLQHFLCSGLYYSGNKICALLTSDIVERPVIIECTLKSLHV